MRSGYITVHHPETGESKTYGPEDELPDWAEEIIQEGNPQALLDDSDPSTEESDLIGGGPEEDPLMKRTHVELVLASEQWDATGVSASNKKAELVAAIRAAGYEGDGSDLLDGE